MTSLLEVSYCAPNASSCYATISKKSQDCRVSCSGINADIKNTDTTEYDDTLKDLAAFTKLFGKYGLYFFHKLKQFAEQYHHGLEIQKLMASTKSRVHKTGYREKLVAMMDQYEKYKRDFAKNIRFDSKQTNLSKKLICTSKKVISIFIFSLSHRVCPS